MVRQSLIGKNATINVEFKNGKSATYNHDKVFSIMQSKLETMACWAKYKSYTASNNLPVLPYNSKWCKHEYIVVVPLV